MTAANAVLAAGTLGGIMGVLGGIGFGRPGPSRAGSALTVATNGLVWVTGNGTSIFGTLTNAGTMRLVDAGLTLSGDGLLGLVNLPGALVDMQSDVGISYYLRHRGDGESRHRAQVGRKRHECRPGRH